MNRLLVASALLVSCAPSIAQVWSPRPAYQSVMGDGITSMIGRYSVGRYQIVDGNFRSSAMRITKISMRTDEKLNYTATNGLGRSWSDVIVDAAPTDLDKITTKFQSNHMSTTTRCFRGKLSWPTVTGVQSNPLSNYPVQVPFSTPFLHLGKGADFLLDFRMSGGVLANNSGWAAGTSQHYALDTYSITSYKVGQQRIWHDSNAGGCLDSNAWTSKHAEATQFIARYSTAFPIADSRGKIRVLNNTNHVGRNQPFLNVVTFGVLNKGVPYGSGCQKLYLDLSMGPLFYPSTADVFGNGPTNEFGLPHGLVKPQPSWDYLELFTQSVWHDSKTNDVKLTSASSCNVPVFVVNNRYDARVGMVFASHHGPLGAYNRYNSVNPIVRYN